MKKIIQIFLLSFVLLFANKAFAADVIVPWTTAMDTAWDAMQAGNHTLWQYVIDRIGDNDDADVTNDQYNYVGVIDAIYYHQTNNTTYAVYAWNHWSFWAGRTYNTTGQTPDANGLRDLFVVGSWVYGTICGGATPGAGTTNCANFKDILNYWVDRAQNHYVSGPAFNQYVGTRPGDTDQEMGSLFGIYLFAAEISLQDPTRSAAILSYSGTMQYANASTRSMGGLTPSGANSSTNFRDRVSNYFTVSAYGGEWVESNEYNMDTLGYIYEAQPILTFIYGHDYFPEVTAAADAFASNAWNMLTPNFAKSFEWGDNQPEAIDQISLYRASGFMTTLIAASGDEQLCYVFNQRLAELVTSTRKNEFLPMANGYCTSTAPSGVTEHFSSGVGTGHFHSGWGVNDTKFSYMIKNKTNVDHDALGWRNFNIDRQGGKAFNQPKGYYVYADSQYMNGLLVSGGLPSLWQEARGNISKEVGSNYVYADGVVGGNTVGTYTGSGGAGYYDPPALSLNENFLAYFYYHHTDGSDTVVQWDRVNALNPVTMANGNYTRMPAVIKTIITTNGGTGKHVMYQHAPNDPTESGGIVTWTAENGLTSYFQTFMPNFTYTEQNMNGVPSPGNTMSAAQAKWRFRITDNDTAQHQTFAHIAHQGSVPTNTQYTSSAGEFAKGYKIEAGTENLLVIFNAADRTSQLPAASPLPTTGSTKFNQLAALHYFDTGFTMSVTVDGTTNSFITDIDPAQSWMVSIDGGTATAISETPAGLYNFTLTSGTHTINLANSGSPAATCATDPSLCNPGNCVANGWCLEGGICLATCSAATCATNCLLCNSANCVSTGPSCYLWGSGACMTTAEPTCATTPSLCGSDAVACVNAGWVFCNDQCQATATSGAVAGTTCNCSGNDIDTLSCSCTVTQAANQIMIIAVGQEEVGDPVPDSVTWNGDAATLIGTDSFWFDSAKSHLYYLLTPDVGDYTLNVTYTAGASVDPVVGMQTFSGLTLQAPEVSGTAEEDVPITTLTDAALLVSTITSIAATDFTPTNDLTTKVYERDNSGMSNSLGYGITTTAGSKACNWNDTQASGDRSGTVCASFEAAAACENETTPITSESGSMGGGEFSGGAI